LAGALARRAASFSVPKYNVARPVLIVIHTQLVGQNL
jgi:hypothetical protein